MIYFYVTYCIVVLLVGVGHEVGRMVHMAHVVVWLCGGSGNNHKVVKTYHWLYGWSCGTSGRVVVGRAENQQIGRAVVA